MRKRTAQLEQKLVEADERLDARLDRLLYKLTSFYAQFLNMVPLLAIRQKSIRSMSNKDVLMLYQITSKRLYCSYENAAEVEILYGRVHQLN